MSFGEMLISDIYTLLYIARVSKAETGGGDCK